MIRRRERREACVIGILYESDEWSDWKLGRELEAALAENALAEAVPAEASSQTATRESDAADNSWRHARMINMEDAGAVEQARSCAMLVSRVFASAAFRGTPAFSPGPWKISSPWPRLRASCSSILVAPITSKSTSAWPPKRCATRASRLQLSSHGDTRRARQRAADLDDSRSVALSREEASRLGVPDASEAEIASPQMAPADPDHGPTACIIKAELRRSHHAHFVLRSPAAARAFLSAAPNLVFIIGALYRSRRRIPSAHRGGGQPASRSW